MDTLIASRNGDGKSILRSDLKRCEPQMIKVTLYNSLPSNTWALAYRVPWTDVIGFMAGIKTRERAKRAVDHLSRVLGAPVECGNAFHDLESK